MRDSVHIGSELSIYFGNARRTKDYSLNTLYDQLGRRKYLILNERTAFLAAARTEVLETATFCEVMAYTGARISEVLALTADRVDVVSGVIVFETLKRREKGVFRAVPVPQEVIQRVAKVHKLGVQNHLKTDPAERLWPWCRTTGFKRIKRVMRKAGVEGPQASPKGLRHGFAVVGLQAGIPLNLVSRWLGHADLETTAIYANAVGDEEKSIAQRFWQTF